MSIDCTTLEIEIVDVDLNKTVPCSGTGHHTGLERNIHGDPDQPAEWLVLQRCPNCLHTLRRPVCDFFKEHGMGEYRLIRCSRCRAVSSADRYFTVLHRL